MALVMSAAGGGLGAHASSAFAREEAKTSRTPARPSVSLTTRRMIAEGWRVCKDHDMRVAYTSDLHVEHHPEVVRLVAQRVEQLGPDVLVLAGDISHELSVVEDTLRPFAGRKTLFVPGNHELWAKDSEVRYLEELAEC